MTQWFISRHPGACEWIRTQSISIDQVIAHLDPADVKSGDTVYGSLPINLAARLCERGARYVHLSLDVPFEWRGMELSADQLTMVGARFEEFEIIRVAPGRLTSAVDA